MAESCTFSPTKVCAWCVMLFMAVGSEKINLIYIFLFLQLGGSSSGLYQEAN